MAVAVERVKAGRRQMITRAELYRLVWAESVLSLSRKLGVSHIYLRKVCAALEVPRPGLGYWAKRAAGRAPPIPELPPLRPGSPDRWSRDRSDCIRIKPFYKARFAARAVADDAAEHPLVRAARPHFEAAATRFQRAKQVREASEAGGGAYSGGTGAAVMEAEDAADAAANAEAYLELPKRLSVIDVITSGPTLPASLDLAGRLYRALESRGHRVLIAGTFEPFVLRPVDRDAVILGRPRDPGQQPVRRRPTVAYVGPTPIGLAVVEGSEKRKLRYAGYGRFLSEKQWRRRPRAGYSWTVTRWVPTGLLTLVAYSPIVSVRWRQGWSESRKGQLVGRVEEIAADLEEAAQAIGDRRSALPIRELDDT